MHRINTEEKQNRYENNVLFTDNFSLFFSSTNPNKVCDMKVSKSIKEPNIDCHDEQVIAECFLTHNNDPGVKKPISVCSFLGYPFPNDGANYLFGNFGVVISDKEYKEHGDHKRTFVSAPICCPSAHVYACEEDVHSEELLLKCFLQKENNKLNLENISLLFKNIEKGRMIYSLVFDLHSSRDVCNRCAKAIYQFQTTHTDNFINFLLDSGFFVPKDKNKFKIIFRISSTLTFEPYQGSVYTKPDKPLDVASSVMPSIIHSNEEMRKKLWRWYKKESYAEFSKFSLNNYSVFTNQRGKSKGLSEIDKIINSQTVRFEI